MNSLVQLIILIKCRSVLSTTSSTRFGKLGRILFTLTPRRSLTRWKTTVTGTSPRSRSARAPARTSSERRTSLGRCRATRKTRRCPASRRRRCRLFRQLTPRRQSSWPAIESNFRYRLADTNTESC